jgi:hypothetical protein
MTRLFWYVLGLAGLFGLVALVSWILAYHTVDNMLGAPPPQMGNSTTSFLWEGMPRTASHPRAWRFAYGPTTIPGAPRVTFFVSPLGELLRVEPADLPTRIKIMQNRGFN